MRLKFIASALLGLAVANAKIVMIIRHGEKLNDKVTNLSEKGQARAECLIEAFGPNGYYATPQKIYAQSPSEKKQSTRPRDTVVPLAKSLGLEVDLSYTSGKVKKLVNDIEASPEEVVLISWSNDKINDIAEKFDIKNPPKWNGDVFDDIWVITDGKTSYIKNSGAQSTANLVVLGKHDMNLYVVKENVDECITRVIDGINHKTSQSTTTQTSQTNMNTNNNNNNSFNNHNNNNINNNNNNINNNNNNSSSGNINNTTQQPESKLNAQNNVTVSSNNITLSNNNAIASSDSKISKFNIITIAVLAVTALCIIY